MWREDRLWIGIEVEVGWKAVRGEIDFRRLVGVIRVGLPLVGFQKVARDGVEHAQQKIGLFAIDHARDNRFGKLGERGLHSVHVFERWKFEGIAAGTGTGLGPTHPPDTEKQMIS